MTVQELALVRVTQSTGLAARTTEKVRKGRHSAEPWGLLEMLQRSCPYH